MERTGSITYNLPEGDSGRCGRPLKQTPHEATTNVMLSVVAITNCNKEESYMTWYTIKEGNTVSRISETDIN